MLGNRSMRTFEKLMNRQTTTSIALFLKGNQMTKRQFFYDLEKINAWLHDQRVPLIEVKKDILFIPLKLKEFWEKEQSRIYPIQFDENDRIFLLFFYTFIRTEPLSNAHYRSFLRVSKNTVGSDILKANQFGESFRVQIKYSREKGFYLFGAEEDKRNLILKCISLWSSQEFSKEKLSYVFNRQGFSLQYLNDIKKIKKIEEAYQLKFIEERMSDFIYLLQMLSIRQKQNKWVQLYPDTKEFILKHEMFEVAKSIQEEFELSSSIEEIAFLTIQLLGITLGKPPIHSSDILFSITERIVQDFERFTCIQLNDKQKVIDSLYRHLSPAYFRMLFKIPITNALLQEIKKEHSTLFSFVQEVMNPIGEMLNIEIPEEEIGYLTLHFGAILENHQDVIPTAVIVCPNGISSSLMLETQLTSMFPHFHWKPALSEYEFNKLSPIEYDVVFSTVLLQTKKPLFILKPLLSKYDKKALHQSVSEQIYNYPTSFPTPERLLKIIKRFADIKDRNKLKEALKEELYVTDTRYGRKQPVLQELLTEDMIQLDTHVKDWREGIWKCAEPLLTKGVITDKYVEAVLENIEKLGPYIIIGPEIAIPHARPEHGVHRVGMSLLKLQEPIYLLDDEKNSVKLIICLASPDNTTHLKALSQLTKLLSNPASLERLKKAQSKSEILLLIHEYSA